MMLHFKEMTSEELMAFSTKMPKLNENQKMTLGCIISEGHNTVEFSSVLTYNDDTTLKNIEPMIWVKDKVAKRWFECNQKKIMKLINEKFKKTK